MLKQLIIIVMFLGLFMFACDKTEPEPDKPQSQVSRNQEEPEPKKRQQPEKSESKKPPQEKPEPGKTEKDLGGANKGTSEVVSPALLIDAIKKGQVAKAKGFISSKKVDLNGKDSNGYAPLNYAALYGHKDIVEDLLTHNAKVDEAGPFNLTALHYAAFLGNKDIAESLIKKGAKVNALDNYKNTPLHLAYYRGHDDLKALLEANGANKEAENNIPNLGEGKPQAPQKVVPELFSAILFADDAALVAALIERHSLDIYAELEAGITPFLAAMVFGRPMIFKFLKGKGIDLPKLTQKEVIEFAGKSDAQIFAELLDATGIEATAADEKGTLLRQAFNGHNAEVFELLVNRGADINEKDEKGLTFLDHLAQEHFTTFDEKYNLFKMLKTLLKKNVQVKDENIKELQATIVDYTVGHQVLGVKAHVPTDLVKEVFGLTEKRVKIKDSDFDLNKAQVKKALEDLRAK